MNAYERRQLAHLKERLQRNDCEGALRILQPLLPRKASEKSKATRARKRARTAAKSARNEVRSGTLRAMVAALAGDLCELAWKTPHLGHEPHHLLSGSAKRIDEKPENVLWTCRFHHDAYHRRPADFIDEVIARSDRHGFPVPGRILRLERRLASLPAARRSV